MLWSSKELRIPAVISWWSVYSDQGKTTQVSLFNMEPQLKILSDFALYIYIANDILRDRNCADLKLVKFEIKTSTLSNFFITKSNLLRVEARIWQMFCVEDVNWYLNQTESALCWLKYYSAAILEKFCWLIVIFSLLSFHYFYIICRF